MKKAQPVIQIDTREKRPLVIEGFETERVTLPVGDYGVKGFSDWTNPAFAVERKSLQDLVSSLGRDRERFLREVEKLRGFRFRALLIEADREAVKERKYRGLVTPESVFGTLDALTVRAGLHVCWCGDPRGAARRLENFARLFVRGVERDFERLGTAAG